MKTPLLANTVVAALLCSQSFAFNQEMMLDAIQSTTTPITPGMQVLTTVNRMRNQATVSFRCHNMVTYQTILTASHPEQPFHSMGPEACHLSGRLRLVREAPEAWQVILSKANATYFSSQVEIEMRILASWAPINAY